MVALMALVAAAASADSRIAGVVVDSDGQPVAKAKVKLQDEKGGYDLSFETDKKGRFYRRGVMPRRYTLTIEKEGYVAHIIEDVLIQAGTQRDFEVTLMRPEDRKRQARLEAGGEAYAEGTEAFEQGEFEKAVEEMRERVAKAPDDQRARLILAESLYKLGRYEEAIPHFEAAAAADPTNGELHQRLGQSNLKLGRTEQAMAAFGRAEGLTDDPAVSYNIGALLMKEGKPAEARAAFERALTKQADYALALNGLAHVHLHEQNYPRALELLKAYLAAEPAAADAAEMRTLIQELEKLTATN